MSASEPGVGQTSLRHWGGAEKTPPRRQGDTTTAPRPKLLGHRERSTFLARDDEHAQIRIKTHRCPVCDLSREEWEETKTAVHYSREDHTFEALKSAARRRESRYNGRSVR